GKSRAVPVLRTVPRRGRLQGASGERAFQDLYRGPSIAPARQTRTRAICAALTHDDCPLDRIGVAPIAVGAKETQRRPRELVMWRWRQFPDVSDVDPAQILYDDIAPDPFLNQPERRDDVFGNL